MGQEPGGPNQRLAACLDELGWSPKALARKLNKSLGPGTVSETAPYHWRDHGGVPRPPMPAAVAHVISTELGRTITAHWLWPDRPHDHDALTDAAAELTGPWTTTALAAIMDGWVHSGLRDRRRFLAASGSALVALVSNYLDTTGQRGTYTNHLVETDRADPLADQVERNLPLLQLLDDEHGGARHLSYVGAQFRSVALLLREHDFPTPIAARLLRALGEIGQLAGWMSFDAGHHGLAQRYFATALRAAHQVNDDPLAAHILADLAFQAASRDLPADAVPLGEAAARLAAHATAGARASVLSRLAYAYASAGRANDFERTRTAAREELTSQRPDADEPRWMYYLTAEHLDCQAGYAHIKLGRSRRDQGLTAEGRRHLRHGTLLLAAGAHSTPRSAAGQRRALFEGAWLTLGYTALGETEEACRVAATATQRLANVDSPRSTALLHQVAGDLRRRQRNPHVRTFLPDLEHELTRHATATPRRR